MSVAAVTEPPPSSSRGMTRLATTNDLSPVRRLYRGFVDDGARGSAEDNSTAFDVTLTVALLLAGLGGLFYYPEIAGVEYRDADALGMLLVAITTLPLLARRRAPIASALFVAVSTLAFLEFNYSIPTATVVMIIAVYSAGAYGRFGWSILVVAAMTASSIAYVFFADEADDTPGFTVPSIVLALLAFVVVWGVGRTVQARRLYTAELEDRTERLLRTRAAEIRAALAEERSRIARELHDVVAHHVSVMTVQAAGAGRALKRDPEASAQALRSIEVTGRSALSEMRRIVGVLRGPDGDSGRGSGAEAGLTPAPRLADVAELADHLRDTGLPVEITVDGDPASLPAGVDLTAYRIVQEALTNTIKHAGPATTAYVVITYSPGQVEVVVSDDGRGLAAALDGREPGHGLMGMRERVALYGGSLVVGPRRGGGFEVRARIPYDTTAV